MRNVSLLLFCLLFLAGSAMAVAPSPPVSLYAGGLVSVPSSPDLFSDGYKTGYHGTVGVGLKAAPNFQLVGKFEYHTFKSEAAGLLGIQDGSRNILMFGGDARFSPSMPAAPVKPFFLAGIGFANVKQDSFTGPSLLTSALNTAIPPGDETKFYFNIGAGIDLFSTPKLGMFIQARYVNVATSGEALQFIPVTLGLKFF